MQDIYKSHLYILTKTFEVTRQILHTKRPMRYDSTHFTELLS